MRQTCKSLLNSRAFIEREWFHKGWAMTNNQIYIIFNKNNSGWGDSFPMSAYEDVEQCGVRKSKVLHNVGQA